MGGWVEEIEENEAVKLRCCGSLGGGWVGGWVGGRTLDGFIAEVSKRDILSSSISSSSSPF